MALVAVLVVLSSFKDEGVGSSFMFAGAHRHLSPFKVVDGGGVIHDPHSWAVGFAGCHLSLFMGCGSFVAMAVICGVCCFLWSFARGGGQSLSFFGSHQLLTWMGLVVHVLWWWHRMVVVMVVEERAMSWIVTTASHT